MTTTRRDKHIGVIIAFVMCTLSLVIGIWGLQRVLSTGVLSKKTIADASFFAVFALAGIWGACFALASAWERCPVVVHACLWSFFLVILGSPFLYIGIYLPEQIQGSVSFTGLGADVSREGGSTLGGVVFVLVGVTCFGAVPIVWRGFMKKGWLKKVDN
jgi:hypothetical protein